MTLQELQTICGASLVTSAVMLVALERIRPYCPGQRLLRRGALTDFVMYSLVQGYVLALFVSFLLHRLEPLVAPVRVESIEARPRAYGIPEGDRDGYFAQLSFSLRPLR